MRDQTEDSASARAAVGRTNGREQIDAAPDENGKGDRRLKRAELPRKREEGEDGNSGVLREGTRV